MTIMNFGKYLKMKWNLNLIIKWSEISFIFDWHKIMVAHPLPPTLPCFLWFQKIITGWCSVVFTFFYHQCTRLGSELGSVFSMSTSSEQMMKTRRYLVTVHHQAETVDSAVCTDYASSSYTQRVCSAACTRRELQNKSECTLTNRI